MQALLPIALFAVEQLLKHAPNLFIQFKAIINKENVTLEELKAERDRVANLSYDELVPNDKP